VALWKDDNPQQALEVAQCADQRYPDHADIKCLLARAYLKLPSPDPQKAEAALHRASELGCVRPEMMTLWIEAKRQLKDWVGLLEITRHVKGCHSITARTAAYSALAEIALKSSNFDRAARHLHTGAEEAHEALERQDARGREGEVRQWRRNLSRTYIGVLDQYTRASEDRLRVWQACLDIFRRDDGDADLLAVAVRNLAMWWGTVEKRERWDPKAHELMLHHLRSANRIIGDERAKDKESDLTSLMETQKLLSELQSRANRRSIAHDDSG
jgi:hypothetical protein